MIVLGIHSHRGGHNAAASILIDGRLVASVEEERISRIKGDSAYPAGAVAEVLVLAGLRAQDVDRVAQAGLACDQPLGVLADKPCQVVEHQQAHAASAYYASSFGDERVGVLTLDGDGDASSGSVWVGEAGCLRKVVYLPRQSSMGLLYAAITQYLGFIAGRHEGKVLGLAAFGQPQPFLSRLLARSHPGDWNALFDAHLGALLCSPWSPMARDVLRDLCGDMPHEDIAAGLQAFTEQMVCTWVQQQMAVLNVNKLVLAGDVFANVKLNQRILALPGVQNLFVPPNMGDGGLASGAAFEIHARLHGGLRPELASAYLGTDIDRASALQALQKAGMAFEEPVNLVQTVAQRLAEGQVIARADGKMEYGPRALGNRTVMAAAHDPRINQWLNQKFARTEFMPFAPVILQEQASAYFPGWDAGQIAARFMTLTYDASDLAMKNIPAAVHVDGTARPQVLWREDNPGYYDILKAYHAATGIPSVINTSFNMHEEPIVRTAEEALSTFKTAGLDALVLGPFLVRSSAQ